LDRDIFGEEYHKPRWLGQGKSPGCAGLLMLIPGHLPASKIAGWAITKGLSTINSGYWWKQHFKRST
jgi:hypothetical protein